jgi:LCP family protein required for cell wall assembly
VTTPTGHPQGDTEDTDGNGTGEAPEPDESPQPAAAPEPEEPATVDEAPEPDESPQPQKPAAAGEPAAGEPLQLLASGEPGTEAPAPRRRRRWLRYVAGGTALLVLAGGAGLWYVYRQLNGNITTDNVTETELKAQAPQRPPAETTAAENILLIGSDSRAAADSKYGRDTGTQRSDTTILLHISADRSNATAISIPRDLMVQQPECVKADGSTVKARYEQFNWAFEFGGAACTIRTVEELTGVRVDHHLTVDFSGFTNMVNAVGGVEVCVAEPVHDKDAHLDLPAGKQKLDGEQALGYVRARHGIGDGSDTGRIGRQQDFLASLAKKVQSNGVLLNPEKVYPLLNAATKSLTADPGLNSLSELYKLARTIQKIPTGAIHFVTTPVEPYVQDPNRDQLVQPDADRLFQEVRDDVPVSVSDSGHTKGVDSGVVDSPESAGPSTGTPTDSPTGSPSGAPTSSATSSPSGTPAGSPSASPTGTATGTPTFIGTTADRDICGKDR